MPATFCGTWSSLHEDSALGNRELVPEVPAFFLKADFLLMIMEGRLLEGLETPRESHSVNQGAERERIPFSGFKSKCSCLHQLRPSVSFSIFLNRICYFIYISISAFNPNKQALEKQQKTQKEEIRLLLS